MTALKAKADLRQEAGPGRQGRTPGRPVLDNAGCPTRDTLGHPRDRGPSDAAQPGAVGWAFVTWTALKPEPHTRDARAAARMRTSAKNASFAIALYTTCAIVAVWLPLAIAMIITVMWLYWGSPARGRPPM